MKNSTIKNIKIIERIIYLSLWGIAFAFFLMIAFLLYESWLILLLSTLLLFIFLITLIAAAISLIRITKEKNVLSSNEEMTTSSH
jgi:predicted tellurium resistance membrane protein TerC